MKNAVTTTPTLPGLLPDAEVLALAESFRASNDFRNAEIARWPTAPERERMVRRSEQIMRVLRPLTYSSEDMQRAKEIVSDLFLGYHQTRSDPNQAKLVAAYLTHLQDVPVFAIKLACEDIKANRVFDVDRRSGNRIPLAKDYPPSSIRIHSIASGHAQAVAAEKGKIDRVVSANRIASPPVTDAERARVAEKFAGLKTDLHASEAARLLQTEERRQRGRQFIRDGQDRMIRAEYVHLKKDPVIAGEYLVSPALAAKVKEDLRKMAEVPKETRQSRNRNQGS